MFEKKIYSQKQMNEAITKQTIKALNTIAEKINKGLAKGCTLKKIDGIKECEDGSVDVIYHWDL